MNTNSCEISHRKGTNYIMMPHHVFLFLFFVAKKQIHEEDPQRCRGIKRLGG